MSFVTLTSVSLFQCCQKVLPKGVYPYKYMDDCEYYVNQWILTSVNIMIYRCKVINACYLNVYKLSKYVSWNRWSWVCTFFFLHQD